MVDKNKIKVVSWPWGDYLYYSSDLQSTKKGRTPCSPHHGNSDNTKQNWISFQRMTSLSHISFWLIVFSHQSHLWPRQNPTEFFKVPSATEPMAAAVAMHTNPVVSQTATPVFLLHSLLTLPQSSFPQRPQPSTMQPLTCSLRRRKYNNRLKGRDEGQGGLTQQLQA